MLSSKRSFKFRPNLILGRTDYTRAVQAASLRSVGPSQNQSTKYIRRRRRLIFDNDEDENKSNKRIELGSRYRGGGGEVVPGGICKYLTRIMYYF